MPLQLAVFHEREYNDSRQLLLLGKTLHTLQKFRVHRAAHSQSARCKSIVACNALVLRALQRNDKKHRRARPPFGSSCSLSPDPLHRCRRAPGKFEKHETSRPRNRFAARRSLRGHYGCKPIFISIGTFI
jgi:hypothetical protein